MTSVYFKGLENDMFMLYVDNMFVASQNMVEIRELKAQLERTFQMKNQGEEKQILGIEVHMDKQYGKLRLIS